MATNTKKKETVEEAVEAVEATEETTVTKVDATPGEKMVKIKIPREKTNQEDVFVSVNMRTWLIKRGVWVEVPECVSEVLEHQEEMFEKINLFNEEKASE